MVVLSDYHLHSSFSGDSGTPMESMIKKAISLGLKSMCFTEHMDIDYVYVKKEDTGMFELNTDFYLLDLINFKEKYKEKIDIYFGVELGLQPHISREMSKYVKEHDFDFIIGSSHLCNKKDPYFPYFYEDRPEEEAYREYFYSILDNLKAFQNFDVYGHLDYVVRYGPNRDKNYSYEKYKDVLDSILSKLIDMEKGIEINTGGVSYGLKDLNPCIGIIRRYKELGGEIITIGSDAHTPDRICKDFTRAADILKECGYKYYTVFAKRMPEYVRL
ncbi:MAG: histidinol-phosphatase HisJ family protein [Clostridiales bacterium]|nr:histidinol-phosphatase HisJ family protein [Clostridiales bacterium]